MAYTKYSLTPANNTAAPPDGAPEGMLPSAVNDTMRDMMAQIRDCGDGIRDGTYTMTAPKITGGTITGSTINNSAIGGTTAAAGKFTTLEATGATTFSGATVVSASLTANTFSSSGATITGGSVTGITDLAIADGGTGASTAAGARTNLGLDGFVNMKNRIINGAMTIDQRNAGASVANAVGANYFLDRWQVATAQASKMNIQQNAGSVTPPVGFSNYLGLTVTSAYTAAAADYYLFAQKIEGFNASDLGFGTANAKTVTVSFQVRSSLTGTFCAALQNAAGNRTYIFNYTISSANTWTTITQTIVGDTSGTWGSGNSSWGELKFDLGSGSDFQTATVGSWAATGAFTTASAVKFVANASATFYITGVQLEVGSTATSFDYRPYTTELQLAQRYFEKIGGSQSSDLYIDTYGVSGGACMYCVQYKVTKRANPTGTVVGTFTKSGNVGSLYFGNTGVNTCSLQGDVGSTARAFFYNSDTSAYITISAEL